jgi:nitroimidazol reductase NimA-like FMN-containing flavoprotein (pyridoxamine 5'-phosphate oxidase superfamily)
MRRKDREVTDLSEIIEIMKNCDVCRLALNDDGFPYILPLNFGLSVNVDKITLYFHSALEGYKVGLIQKDNRASFEMDCKHELQYFEDKGYCTMAYESVIGKGHIRILPEEEKLPALKLLMAHYHDGKDMPFSTAAIPRTLVYALEVESITGKRKPVNCPPKSRQ